jgi:hypothetical protein
VFDEAGDANEKARVCASGIEQSQNREPRIFTNATDFHRLSVSIRRIRENPRFLILPKQ